MAERNRNIRNDLIQAGIAEINANGISKFSVRRVAGACGVSCAAPYRHFKDKDDFIAAIIDFVNDQWGEVQNQILANCSDDLREQLVSISVGYVQFLMEKPYYRSILMYKDDQFNNLYHKKRGESNSRTQRIMQAIQEKYNLDGERWRRKMLLVLSSIYGSVFLIDNGEYELNQTTLDHIRYNIDREFELF